MSENKPRVFIRVHPDTYYSKDFDPARSLEPERKWIAKNKNYQVVVKESNEQTRREPESEAGQ